MRSQTPRPIAAARPIAVRAVGAPGAGARASARPSGDGEHPEEERREEHGPDQPAEVDQRAPEQPQRAGRGARRTRLGLACRRLVGRRPAAEPAAAASAPGRRRCARATAPDERGGGIEARRVRAPGSRGPSRCRRTRRSRRSRWSTRSGTAGPGAGSARRRSASSGRRPRTPRRPPPAAAPGPLIGSPRQQIQRKTRKAGTGTSASNSLTLKSSPRTSAARISQRGLAALGVAQEQPGAGDEQGHHQRVHRVAAGRDHRRREDGQDQRAGQGGRPAGQPADEVVEQRDGQRPAERRRGASARSS